MKTKPITKVPAMIHETIIAQVSARSTFGGTPLPVSHAKKKLPIAKNPHRESPNGHTGSIMNPMPSHPKLMKAILATSRRGFNWV